jgi:tetratricopeptide (TPR) repeat protein
LARLDNPVPPISPRAAEMLALGWEGKDSPAVYAAIREAGIENKETWFRLGLQLFELGRHAESFDCFERVSGLEREGLEKFASLGWMGLLKDQLGKRLEALTYYREALKFDTGRSMRFDQFGIRMDKDWLEERLKKPFVWKK